MVTVGDGFFQLLTTYDASTKSLISSGIGLDFGDESFSANLDDKNFGFFLDLEIGEWGGNIGLSLKNGLTIGHSITSNGVVNGMSASFPPPPGKGVPSESPYQVPVFEIVP